MLHHPLIENLNAMRLRGMASALTHQLTLPEIDGMDFMDRLGLLVDREAAERDTSRLRTRLRFAQIPQQACLEDLDTKTARGIDKATLQQVLSLNWVDSHLNVLVTGPTGVGKSYMASALAQAACRNEYSVRCFRMPRLIDELAKAQAMNNRSGFFRKLAKVDLILIDDFGLAPLTPSTVRDLLEIIDDRYDKKSTIVTSQLPVEQWHDYLGDPTIADAILDRLIHNSYRLNLSGESMRKKSAQKLAKTTSSNP